MSSDTTPQNATTPSPADEPANTDGPDQQAPDQHGAAPAETASPADGRPAAEDAPDAPSPTPGAEVSAEEALARDLAKKDALLAQARKVVEDEDWRAGSGELRRIFEEWRQIPYRHEAREDALWAELQSVRTAFYEARDANRAAVAKEKERLAGEAKRLAESTEWRATGERFRELMDAWKAAGSAGHDEDERLWAEFSGAQRSFFDRRSKHYREMDREHVANGKAKEALIAEAREAVQVSPEWGAREWKAANARMRDLMSRWKQLGRARKEDNDRLWEEFNGLRQQFFDAQHAHHQELERDFAANAAAKQELIDTARRIAGEQDYSREKADEMRELDVRWKAVGYAGRERNDALWEEFRDAKEGFWEARKRQNEERHAAWVERTEAAAERRRQQIANLEGQIERIQSRIDHATFTTSESQLNEMQGWIDEKRDRIKQVQAELADIEAKLE